MDVFEREKKFLEDDLENGNISQKEYNYEIRELEGAYRDSAMESAQNAYEDELQRW